MHSHNLVWRPRRADGRAPCRSDSAFRWWLAAAAEEPERGAALQTLKFQCIYSSNLIQVAN